MTDDQIQAALSPLRGWHRAEGVQVIGKHFLFDTWRDSMIFADFALFTGERLAITPRIGIVDRRLSVQIAPRPPASLACRHFEYAHSLDLPCGPSGRTMLPLEASPASGPDTPPGPEAPFFNRSNHPPGDQP